jgi:hypothetical protein
MRVRPIILAVLIFLAPQPLWAVEPAGNWKVRLWQNGQFRDVWLIQIEAKGKKYTGKLLSAENEELARVSQVEDLSVAGDRLRFTIRVPGQALKFDCNLTDRPGAKGPVVIPGSADEGGERILAELEQTKLDNIDLYSRSKQYMESGGTDPQIFEAALTLVGKAREKKSSLKEATDWAGRAFAAADRFGPGWKRYLAVNLAEAMAANKELAALGVTYARHAEKLLEPGEKGDERRKILNTLAEALESAGMAKEAEGVRAKLDPFAITKFVGRKNAKNDQVVLVELFTGAQCPPCVGPDLAFDGLVRTYQPSEVVLLQYHIHVPRPDALASPDTESRANDYKVSAAPTIVFNGKPAEPEGGGSDVAEMFYKKYRETIDPLLEGKSLVRLTLGAARKGNKVDVTAEVAPAPGGELPETASLRLVLVEDDVKYKGGNGITTHHHVVRGLLNGEKGWSLKGKKDGLKQTFVVDLDVLRGELRKYLDEFNKAMAFPNDLRPLDLANLRVVAFVQDDATRAVLQAAEAPVVAVK